DRVAVVGGAGLVERLGRPLPVALAPILAQAHVRKACRSPGLEIGRTDENMVCKRPGFFHEAFPQAGGPTLGAGLYRPRVVFRAGEKPVDTGEISAGNRFLKRKRRGSGTGLAFGV